MRGLKFRAGAECQVFNTVWSRYDVQSCFLECPVAFRHFGRCQVPGPPHGLQRLLTSKTGVNQKQQVFFKVLLPFFLQEPCLGWASEHGYSSDFGYVPRQLSEGQHCFYFPWDAQMGDVCLTHLTIFPSGFTHVGENVENSRGEWRKKYLETISWLLLGHSRTLLVGSGNWVTACQGPACKKGTVLGGWGGSCLFSISVGSRNI